MRSRVPMIVLATLFLALTVVSTGAERVNE